MNIAELDRMEKDSIRAFVKEAGASGYLSGRVLDYGCGKQPYRTIIEEAGGIYTGMDRSWFGGGSGGDIGPEKLDAPFDAVLCTQVLQYVDAPARTIDLFSRLAPVLVLTYPTLWPEIRDDRWRFTKLGMEELLAVAGLEVVRHERRAQLDFDGFELAFGYGLIATVV